MTPIGSQDTVVGESAGLGDRTFKSQRLRISTLMLQGTQSGLEAGSEKELTGSGRGTLGDWLKESILFEL